MLRGSHFGPFDCSLADESTSRCYRRRHDQLVEDGDDCESDYETIDWTLQVSSAENVKLSVLPFGRSVYTLSIYVIQDCLLADFSFYLPSFLIRAGQNTINSIV